MSTPGRHKRQKITLTDKTAIIEASKSIPKVADLVKHFNSKYAESTIRTILSDKDNILNAIDEGASSKRARIKSAKHRELESAVLTWLKEVRSKNEPVDGPLLRVCFNIVSNL